MNVKNIGTGGTNTLRFGTGISAAEVSVRGTSDQKLVLSTSTAGDVVTLDDMLSSTYPVSSIPGGIDVVEFSDGSKWSRQELYARAMTGTIGSDILYSSVVNDTFDGKGGGDIIRNYGSSYGSGSDSYLFGSGYGILHIDQPTSAGDDDKLVFGGGIMPSKVAVGQDSSGNVLLTDGVAGDLVKILAMANGNTLWGVQSVTFVSDTNTKWTRAQILDMAKQNAGKIVDGDATVSIAAASANKAEGSGTSTPFTFTLTRTGATTSFAHSVRWTAAGSGAVPADAADFLGGTLPSGTITFAAGDTTKTVTVDVAADQLGELNESFTITLSAPSAGAALGTPSASGVIIDDDTSLAIGPGTLSKTEGNSGTTTYSFTVNRTGSSAGSSSVSWAVAGAGAAPADKADFVGAVLPSGSVTFVAGETSKTVTINVAGDTQVEGDETFSVTLANATGAIIATPTATGTITNDEATISFAANNVSKTEGTGGYKRFIFTLVRAAATGSAGVDWAVSGSGAAPASAADFMGGVLPSGSVTFAAGEISKTIAIDAAGEALVEGDETFTLTLANPTGAAIVTPTATGTILNDDTNLSIGPGAISKTEGNSGSVAYSFTISRSGITTGSSSVDWEVPGWGAPPADASDFVGGVLPSGSVTFAAGETSKTVTVNVAGDTLVEGDETFSVTLANAIGAVITTASATGTIVSDDASIGIAALSASQNEGTGTSTPFTFTLTRTGATAVAHTVNWAAAGGAVGGTLPSTAADFLGGVLPSGSVTFAIGETSKVLTVDVAADQLGEFNESFTVTLSAPSAGAVLGTSSVDAVALNDDTSLQIGPSTVSKTEGNSGSVAYSFTISRPGIGTTGSSSVDWAVTGSGTAPANAADFAGGVLPSGSVTFAAGETSKTVTVNVAGDTLVEGDETFSVTLANAIGAVITTASATGVVVDDDTIYGTAGNDTLVGGTGPDLFVIGQGLDSITGGLGLDSFRFMPSALGAAATNAFTFEDFDRALGEKFDISNIDAIAGGADNAFTFIGTTAFNGTPGQLRYDDTGSVRVIQGNVDNNLIADLTIIVKAAGPVDANWFVL